MSSELFIVHCSPFTTPAMAESSPKQMREWVEKFHQARILVVGDIMADEYIWGSVERISPEAPVPVVRVSSVSTLLGGAANVVNNIATLQAKAFLCGVVGDDDVGKTLSRMLLRKGLDVDGLITDSSRRTTLKTRVIAHNQQVVRVDREETGGLSAPINDQVTAFIKARIPEVDAVIISDYCKGVVTRDLVGMIVEESRKHGKICAVDPKVSHFDMYSGATIITPNHHEAAKATGLPTGNLDEVSAAGRKLLETVQCEAVLITWGERGMVLFHRDQPPLHIDTVAKKVFDVTGAGDTVISTLTLALAVKAPYEAAARLSNFAAGVVVREFGTAAVSKEDLLDALR